MSRLGHASVSMTLWLIAVWVAVFASASPVVLITGLIVALSVQLVFPMPNTPGTWRVRPVFLVVLVVRFVWDLVVAGLQVSGLVLSNRPHKDAIVECATDTDNPIYLTVVAAMCSMVPGTVVLEVDPKGKRMFLHALDISAQGGATGVRDAVAGQEKRVLLALASTSAVVQAGLGRFLQVSSRTKRTPAEKKHAETAGRPLQADPNTRQADTKRGEE